MYGPTNKSKGDDGRMVAKSATKDLVWGEYKIKVTVAEHRTVLEDKNSH